MRRRLALSALPLVVFAACSSNPEGAGDAGGPADAGGSTDSGGSTDATTSADAPSGTCAIPDAGVSPGTGSITGTLANEPLPVVVESVATIDASKLVIRLTDHAGACGASENALTLPGATSVSLEIIDQSYSGTAPPFTVGTYVSQGLPAVDAGDYAYFLSVGRTSLGPTCAISGNLTESVTSGSIAITTLSATRVAGTYDLTIETGILQDGSLGSDHISGAFDTPICNPPASVAPVCCGSATASDDSGSAPPPGADANAPEDDAGSAGDPSAHCVAPVVAVLPQYYSVSPLATWTEDATGMVLTAVVDARQSPPASTPPAQIMGYAGGVLTALYTATNPNSITDAVPDPADGKTIYFAMGGLAEGIYSMPRAGGTAPTEIYTPATGQDVYGGFVVDYTSIYLATRDGSILSMPKGGGATTLLYSAPAGQTIGQLVWNLDDVQAFGSAGINATANSFYWTETATVGTSSPTVIRTARVAGGALVVDAGAPTLVATVPSPIAVTQMLPGYGGTVFFVQSGFAEVDGSFETLLGLYAVAPGGAPQLLDPNGAVPIAIGNTGKYAFYGGDGLSRLVLPESAGYPAPPSILLPNAPIDALGFDDAFGAAVFYSEARCIYAPNGGWD